VFLRLNMRKWITIIVLLCLGVALAVLFENLPRSAQTQTSAPSSKDLAQISLGNDYNAILQKTQQVSSTASQTTFNEAQADAAYANFMLGSPEQRLEAISIARQQYLTATTPGEKARFLDQVANFVTVAKTSDVFNAVFNNEPFKKFNKNGQFSASVAALEQESYNDRHSVVAAGYILFPHVAALTNLDGNYQLTDAQKKEHAKAIADGIPAITQAYQEEVARMTSNPWGVQTPYSYYHWLAYLYGAASRGDPQYEKLAKQNYEALFSYYDSVKGPDGGPLPVLQSRTYEDRMAYARLLLFIGGADNIAAADEQIKMVIQMASSDPNPSQNIYIALLKNIAAGNTLTQTYSVGVMQQTANAYPPFKNFVAKYGVVLK
jgi:hypothetical protein